MAPALSISGVAYAALCIWLAVQFVNRRKKRWIALWAVVAVPVLYVLSTGPMNWMVFRLTPESFAVFDPALDHLYCPVFLVAYYGPAWIQDLLSWWRNLGVPDTPPHNIGLYR